MSTLGLVTNLNYKVLVLQVKLAVKGMKSQHSKPLVEGTFNTHSTLSISHSKKYLAQVLLSLPQTDWHQLIGMSIIYTMVTCVYLSCLFCRADSVLQLNLTGDSLQKFARILHEKGLETAEDAIQYFYNLHSGRSVSRHFLTNFGAHALQKTKPLSKFKIAAKEWVTRSC